MGGEVVVLRYGHRSIRDYRVTSHCCLVARAFGAKKIIIEGEEDVSLKKSIENIVKMWGGVFDVEFTTSWKKTITTYRKKKYKSIHATMYGLPLQKEIKKIRKFDKILFIVGSQKVEKEVYWKSDYNISITSQPHSEIAALVIFLDYFFKGKELEKRFSGAKLIITPQKKGKKISKIGEEDF